MLPLLISCDGAHISGVRPVTGVRALRMSETALHAAHSLEWIGSAPPQSAKADVCEALAHGDAVLLIPGIADELECTRLAQSALELARRQQDVRAEAGLTNTGLTRLHFPAHGGDIGEPAEMCEVILQRVLSYVDTQLPSLRSQLFGPLPVAVNLCDAYAADAFAYSCREPSINVYTSEGEFSPHKDQQVGGDHRT